MPNATAYNETCAAIANVYFNERMFLLHGDSKYIDVLEKTLYNGLISGVGLDGKSFFYTNAMQIKNSFGHPHIEIGRSGWFTCSCCPTNIVRLMSSMPGYMYAQKDDNVMEKILANAVKKAGLWSEPQAFHFPVITKQGINEQGKTVRYLFNYSATPTTIHYTFTNGRELLSDKAVDQNSTVVLNAWGVKIIEEQ